MTVCLILKHETRNTRMQSIIRTLSPISFDAYLQDNTANRKICTPGDRVTGVVRIKQGDVEHVSRVWVDLVGEQVSSGGVQPLYV